MNIPPSRLEIKAQASRPLHLSYKNSVTRLQDDGLAKEAVDLARGEIEDFSSLIIDPEKASESAVLRGASALGEGWKERRSEGSNGELESTQLTLGENGKGQSLIIHPQKLEFLSTQVGKVSHTMSRRMSDEGWGPWQENLTVHTEELNAYLQAQSILAQVSPGENLIRPGQSPKTLSGEDGWNFIEGEPGVNSHWEFKGENVEQRAFDLDQNLSTSTRDRSNGGEIVFNDYGQGGIDITLVDLPAGSQLELGQILVD